MERIQVLPIKASTDDSKLSEQSPNPLPSTTEKQRRSDLILEIGDLVCDKNAVLQHILEETNDGWWEWDLLDTGKHYFSPRFKTVFGYQEEELSNASENWRQLIHPDDFGLLMGKFTEHIEAGGQGSFSQELRYRHKDGSTVWVICKGKALKNRDGKFHRIVGTHTNITSLKLLEKELQRRNEELEEFSSVVSHDLKAPLRGISSLAEWVFEDYFDKLDDRGKKKLKLLKDRVERIDELIDGILKYSRIGKDNDAKETIEIESLIRNIVDLLAPPPQVSIQIETALPSLTYCPIQLMQVFQNIIGNAIQYMDKEKGEVRIGCSLDGDQYRFYIADNGPGIESQYYENIFKIFQTLVHRNNQPSTGMGLTITKRIIEVNGGKIWLESTPGKGTTFYFTVPLISDSKKYLR